MAKQRTESEVRSIIRARSEIDPKTGCWNWTGFIDPGGYGHLMFKSKRMSASRVSYLVFVGEMPDDWVADHLCRNRRCVNPKHLEAVPPKENLLRGEGVAAKNTRKTHCKRGHEFTPENTWPLPNNGRACKQCGRDRANAAGRAKRRESPTFGESYQVKKTHCPAGHPYNQENTYVNKAGHRSCRVCQREGYHRRKSPAAEGHNP